MTPLRTTMRRTLSRDQLDAWLEFEQGAPDLDAWLPALEAWAERFPWPPMGDPRDEDSSTQRSILWRVISPEMGGRPHDCAAWIRSAPGRANAYAVVGHVEACWRRFMADVDDALGPVINEDPFVRQMEIRADRAAAARSLTAIRDLVR